MKGLRGRDAMNRVDEVLQLYASFRAQYDELSTSEKDELLERDPVRTVCIDLDQVFNVSVDVHPKAH